MLVLVAKRLLYVPLGKGPGVNVNLRRFYNLVALRTTSGESIGFHPGRLEVASLDPQAWEASARPYDKESSAVQELLSWSQEPANTFPSENGALVQVTDFSLNLAQICNLRCTYCGAGDGSYGGQKFRADLGLVEKQLRGFLSRLTSGETFRIQFLGGEPLLYPHDLVKITKLAKEIALGNGVKLELSIITNGTLITKDIASFLGQENFQVTLSWDGPSDVQDQFRPTKSGSGSSKDVRRGLDLLLENRSGLRSLHVNSVMGVHNQDVVSSYEFLRSFDFDLYNFGFASTAQDEAASSSYIRNMTVLAENVYKSEGINGLAKIIPFGRFLRTLDQQRPVKNFCGAGKNFIHSDTEGRLYACNWFSGNSKEQIGEIDQLDFSRRSQWLDPLTTRHNCGTCWAKTLCGGGCAFVFKTKNSDPEHRDEQFCDRITHLAALSVLYFGKELKKRTEGEKNETC